MVDTGWVLTTTTYQDRSKTWHVLERGLISALEAREPEVLR